jgi:hypothetical protein
MAAYRRLATTEVHRNPCSGQCRCRAVNDTNESEAWRMRTQIDRRRSCMEILRMHTLCGRLVWSGSLYVRFVYVGVEGTRATPDVRTSRVDLVGDEPGPRILKGLIMEKDDASK